MVGVKARSGRRRRQGSLHKWVRINDRVMEVLISERKIGERFNDTIFRLIREKGELAKENHRLKGLINIDLDKGEDDRTAKPPSGAVGYLPISGSNRFVSTTKR